MEKDASFSAVILAAGLSGRMGVPKLSLRFRGDASFADQCIRQFVDFGCSQISLVVNEEGFAWINRQARDHSLQVQVILNPNPEYGRFFSLQQGLATLSEVSPVFVHNVDNPFVTVNLLKQLQSAWQELCLTDPSGKNNYYIKPVVGGRGGHPVLLGPGVAGRIRRENNNPESLKSYLANFPAISVPSVDPKVLVNINTLADYHANGLPSGI